MSMFTYIFIGVAAIIIVFLVVALQPGSYRVSRSSKMSAPPARVFEQINDFRQWEAWSPWAALDPDCRYTYAGPPSGVGSVFNWSGNNKVGEGTLTITESAPTSRVVVEQVFVRPFRGTSTAEFRVEPGTAQTQVTWSMSGRNNFIGRVFCMIMNMDKMLGKDFEKGLANMKAVVEAA